MRLKGILVSFLLLFSFLSFNANSNGFNNPLLADIYNNNKPLESKKAFASFIEEENDKISFKFSIADDYYLYKDKIKIYYNDQEQKIDYQIVSKEQKEDEFFGQVEVFKYNLSFTVDKKFKNSDKDINVKLEYQGCAEKLSLCYPKETESIHVINKNYKQDISNTLYNSLEDVNYFSDFLIGNSLYLNLSILLVLGVLLAFTPCVFPIYPLILSIISKNRKKVLAVSVYSIGYIFAYFVIGLVFSLYKLNLQLFFQIDTIFYILAALFFLIALSCFDFISVGLPQRLTSYINDKINMLYSKLNIINLFFIGFLSALVISPCAVAPVSGVLIVINQINDWVIGGLYLTVLALGMMLPFIIISFIGKKVKIKSGSLVFFKNIIGFLMLFVAVYILSKKIEVGYVYFLYSLIISLFILSLVKIKKLYKKILFILFALISLWAFNDYKSPEGYSFYHQVNVISLEDIKKEVLLSSGKEPVLINIHADWCVECLRMKKTTLNDSEVKNILKRYKVINVDVTENKNTKQILDYFNLQTVPIYVLYNSSGEKNNKYLLGYIEKSKFIDIINNIK